VFQLTRYRKISQKIPHD